MFERYGNFQPSVISVILNTNRRTDTLACLLSLKANSYINHKAIVLDNRSSDGSVKAIHEAYPAVEVVELAENRGYAGNNNLGVRMALARGADWVFVLNEDTVVGSDCLSRLVEVGESDPRIGIMGPMVYHYDEPSVIQSAGGSLGRYWEALHFGQNEPDQGQFSEPRDVDWIAGCGIMLRRGVVEDVGLIDERYFYYWEETEWCIRAARRGWRVVHAPHAKLWHKGVQRIYRPVPSVTYYATRNRLLTLAKHQAPPYVWLSALGAMARTLASWSIRRKWLPLREHRDAMWQGMVDFLRCRWGRMTQ